MSKSVNKNKIIGVKKNVFPKSYHDKPAESKFDLSVEEVEHNLKPLIISIVERAFRRYCQRHGAPISVEDLEWTRFKKILNGML